MNTINIKDFSIDTYLIGKNTPLVVVLPGGGYMQLTENEGRPVAEKLNKNGYSAIVFKYSTFSPVSNCMRQLNDLITYLKENEEVSFNSLHGIGFSAGANLLSNYCGLYKEDCLFNSICLSYGLYEPARGISSIKEVNDLTSKVSEIMVGKENPTDEELAELMPINHVAGIPTFMWTTKDDMLIPYTQTVNYANKLIENNVLCEFHVFSHGNHGLSLADETSATKPQYIQKDIAIWFDMMINFFERNKREK